jgi:hypothetical protein
MRKSIILGAALFTVLTASQASAQLLGGGGLSGAGNLGGGLTGGLGQGIGGNLNHAQHQQRDGRGFGGDQQGRLYRQVGQDQDRRRHGVRQQYR